MYIGLLVLKDEKRKPWNGETSRFKNVGVCGTVQTTILIAEYLASKKHIVDIYSNNIVKSTYNNVNYKNINELNINTEILIVPSHICFTDYDKSINLQKIKKFIILYQCTEFVEEDSLINFKNKYQNIEIIGVYPSEWTKNASYIYKIDHIFNKKYVIPNPLMLDVLQSKDIINFERKLNFITNCTFERGGYFSLKVLNSLPIIPNKITIMDYLINIDYEISTFNNIINNIEIIPSADKETVLTKLGESSYFLYLLTLPSGIVHKDTFACCVAEALAMGTIVLTWKVAALPEMYPENSGIVYMPFPKNVNISSIDGINSYEKTIEQNLLSEDAKQIVINTIMELESNPDRKKELRLKGIEYSRNHYRSEVVCKQWDDVIE